MLCGLKKRIEEPQRGLRVIPMMMAYVPSRRVLREGGYEGAGAMVYYSLPGPWSETVEQRIMDEVTTQLSEGDDESTDRQK